VCDATRRKRAKPKNPRKKENVITFNKKAAPVAHKQENITNARVLLHANDVRGVQMKSVTFAPLTSEVGIPSLTT
jgi:hypothetical protein